jgi:hypothetical protein
VAHYVLCVPCEVRCKRLSKAPVSPLEGQSLGPCIISCAGSCRATRSVFEHVSAPSTIGTSDLLDTVVKSLPVGPVKKSRLIQLVKKIFNCPTFNKVVLGIGPFRNKDACVPS